MKEEMPVHPYEISDSKKKGVVIPNSYPMSIFSEEQARINHGQSLNRLAERGGLTLSEMVCNVKGWRWEQIPKGWTQQDSITLLNNLKNKHQ